jgi:hypothetical protein
LARCPVCKVEQIGYRWAKTKTGKKWLLNNEGKWHKCEKPKAQETKKSFDPFQPIQTFPSYFSCGKCGNMIDNEYCGVCKMYPQVVNRQSGNTNGTTDSKVKPLMTSNRDEIIEMLKGNKLKITSDKIERKGKSDLDKPVNWMHMNEDGTIKNGYKLTDELTRWFDGQGKHVIKTLNEKTILKKKA